MGRLVQRQRIRLVEETRLCPRSRAQLVLAGRREIEEVDAFILVERAKREAAELLGLYESELMRNGRVVECIHLAVLRYLMTAPVDFLERVDALRAVCPEMDRVRCRQDMRARIDEWRQQMDAVDSVLQEDGDDD